MRRGHGAGARNVLGAVLIGIGISLLSQVQSITQFYLCYFIASLGSGAT